MATARLTWCSDGTFTQKSTTVTPSGGYIGLGDFNHDGKLDFATSGNLLALGNGDGTFQTPAPIGSFTSQVILLGSAGFAGVNMVADLNGDGIPDIALLESDTLGDLSSFCRETHVE